MFKVNTKTVKADKGIVYVLEIELEDRVLIKVGVTNRKKVEERVCEILTSIWKKYRIFPRLYVKRYRHFDYPYEIETILHQALKDYSYKTKHVFSGCTEFFDVPLDLVVSLYEVLYDGGKKEDVDTRLRQYIDGEVDEGETGVGESGDGLGNAEVVISGQGVEEAETGESKVCSKDLED